MKNKDIHNGFPLQEVRDLIAKDFNDVLIADCDNKIATIPYDPDNTDDYVIKDSQAHIEYHQKKIKSAETRKALKSIMNIHGWSEHDVSDDTSREANERFHLSFIGSEDEYEELLHKIYPKKKC